MSATYLNLFVGDDEFMVLTTDEGQIDAALTRWLQSNHTADSLLDLTLVAGDSLRIRASQVDGWVCSTAAGRAKGILLDKEADDERKANRAAAGIFEDED